MEVEARDVATKEEQRNARALRETKERAAKWSREFSVPEWLVDVPQDLNGKGSTVGGGWYVVPRPEGKRCLIVACRGKTASRLTHGAILHKWKCPLPSGSPKTAGKSENVTIVECVYYEPSKTYYALDVMCWGGYSLYDCTAEFRFYWLASKLAELDWTGTPFVVTPVPYFDADAKGLRQAYEAPLPYLRDGLLFYCKAGDYALGLTPLVALFKDRQCTRYFAPDDQRVLAVLAVDDDTQLATLDGTVVPRVPDGVDLAPGDLARFEIVDGAAKFDQRCSPKRALPDSSSKIAFAIRHKSRPLRIEDIALAASRAPQA